MRTFLLLAFIFALSGMRSQTGLIGTLVDDIDKTGLSFGFVSLIKADTIVSASTTRADGFFELDAVSPGKYRLFIERTGYETISISNFKIKGDVQNIQDMGNVVMKCLNRKNDTILKGIDFSKGGYTLMVLKGESDHHPLADSLGSRFYFDSPAFLEQLKKEWVFRIPCPDYACGYHYYISLCRNGKKVEEYRINLSCNEFKTDSGIYYMTLDKMRILYSKKPNHLVVKTREFNDREAGMRYHDSIMMHPSLIYSGVPDWINHEGEFRFQFNCPDSCYLMEEEYLKIITAEIEKNYPGEKFSLSSYGWSNREILLKIKCDKSLHDKFKLYKPYSDSWKKYKISHTSYWKK